MSFLRVYKPQVDINVFTDAFKHTAIRVLLTCQACVLYMMETHPVHCTPFGHEKRFLEESLKIV
jgi:hypothetical protein